MYIVCIFHSFYVIFPFLGTGKNADFMTSKNFSKTLGSITVINCNHLFLTDKYRKTVKLKKNNKSSTVWTKDDIIEDLMPDFLHPSAKGHNVMAEKCIKPAIEAMLNEKRV